MDGIDLVMHLVVEVVSDLVVPAISDARSTRRKKKRIKKTNVKQVKKTQTRSANRVPVNPVNNSTVNKVNHKAKEAILKVVKTDGRQDFITALIGTAVALSYTDDGRLDRHEKRMISELLKRYKYDLSKETKKNIRYIKRHKMNQKALIRLYERLNIKAQTVLKITSNLNSLLMVGEKNVTKQKAFLKSIDEHFSNEVDQNAVGF